MRIGIDVGGTNTDAVLMDGRSVLAEVKTATTVDVTDGIVSALRMLLDSSGVEPARIGTVMIGTTHFTNAVVEAKRLMPVAVIRLGAPATVSIPPLIDWPERLRGAVSASTFLCQGGYEYDGREIAPLDQDEIRRVGAEIAEREIRSVAISAVFSPVKADLEREVAALVGGEDPTIAISLSHEIGRIGLLERENATIMNACLRDLAAQIASGFRSALSSSGLEAPVYLSQNDGTLMSIEHAERYPVATFASGPTNSMRGAAFLSGEQDCAVVDIGGTTTDVGVLQHGFPREAAVAVEIGGVRTNFRMPDVLSIGLGGGSIVRANDGVALGPDSVGYELSSRARCFAGETLTATDLAVKAGLAEIGDRSLVDGLDRELVDQGLARAEQMVAEAVDRLKTSAGDVPVVLVGGGSILLGDELPGASRVVRPEHFAVANAIGAAIAQVGGEVERVYALDQLSREDALEQAKEEAIAQAVDAGARADSIEVVDVEEVALAYVPGNATRIKVKAVGELELGKEALAAGR